MIKSYDNLISCINVIRGSALPIKKNYLIVKKDNNYYLTYDESIIEVNQKLGKFKIIVVGERN